MSQDRTERQNIIDDIKHEIIIISSKLETDTQWKKRYSDYAEKILDNRKIIKKHRKEFHTPANLYLYMNISEAKNKANLFNLRYKGEAVADIVFKDNEILLRANRRVCGSDKRFKIDMPKEVTWSSKEAQDFRVWFRDWDVPSERESALESALLTALENNATGKTLPKILIQPVKFADVCRFQMTTPLNASSSESDNAKTARGGGIDILARIGTGPNSHLCVMELKKKPESPWATMRQGVAYAVFLQKLLVGAWSKVFGYEKGYPPKAPITVCIVMPYEDAQKSRPVFNHDIPMDGRVLKLRQLYINKDWNNGIEIDGAHSTFGR